MKITDLEAIVLKDPIGGKSEHYYADTLIIRIHTDEGPVGISEVDSSPAIVKAIIDSPGSSSRCSCRGFRELLLGEDPLNISQIWRKMSDETRVLGMSGAVFHAMSGIDIALWDIKGKASGKAIYQLLGGDNPRPISAYASDVMPEEPSEAIAMVINFRELGFEAAKLGGGPLGADLEADVERVGAIRLAIGDDFPFMIDLLTRWNKETALFAAPRFDSFQLTWIEEPIPWVYPEEYGLISSKFETPIASGERLTSIFEFRSLLEQGVKIIQPDPTRAGGLSGCLAIANLAKDHGSQCIPHIWGTNITLAVALHLVTSISNCPWVEYCTQDTPLRRKITNEPVKANNGKLDLPVGPGLGVTLNEDLVREFSV